MPEPTPSEEPGRGWGKILIMDDDSVVRSALRQMLEMTGYEVDETEDGDGAVERYAEAFRGGNPYRAVILDLTVRGGTGGRDTIEKLLRIDAEVCAVVASGYSDDPVMADARFGFRAAIQKPFKSSELARTLEHLLERVERAIL